MLISITSQHMYINIINNNLIIIKIAVTNDKNKKRKFNIHE